MRTKTTRRLSSYDMVHEYEVAVAYDAATAVGLDDDSKLVPADHASATKTLGRAEGSGIVGELGKVAQGIFLWDNDNTNPAGAVGTVVYWEDATTVTSESTDNNLAGLVYDTDAAGVWVLSHFSLSI